MNIYLVRHGDTKLPYYGDVASIPLTDLGRKQADLTGQRLIVEDIDIIYSSTMTRTKQTAEEINNHLNVPIEYREGLIEIDMGELYKHSDEVVAVKFPEFFPVFDKHEIDIPYPNGESGGDVWKRTQTVLEEITRLDFENIVVVSHGGTIRAILSGISGLPQEKRFFFGSPPVNCGITHIKYQKEGSYTLHVFNDYSHLASLLIR